MKKINDWLWEDKEITESTNDDALLYSQKYHGEKFIISARQQTKGRGRRGRSWIGLEGNLFFSQGIEFEVQNLGQLIFISSLSLYQTIQKFLSTEHSLVLKWPNDVLIDNSKVSGTLLEKGSNRYFIIGIGVNICVAPTNDNLLYPTTSLKEKGILIDRLSFLKFYIENFDINYNLWKTSGFSLIKEQWLAVVKGLGKMISVKTTTKDLYGIFDGVGDQGELLLRQDEEITKIFAGDVFYIEKER